MKPRSLHGTNPEGPQLMLKTPYAYMFTHKMHAYTHIHIHIQIICMHVYLFVKMCMNVSCIYYVYIYIYIHTYTYIQPEVSYSAFKLPAGQEPFSSTCRSSLARNPKVDVDVQKLGVEQPQGKNMYVLGLMVV